jgi:lysyl-tRNA synthetase class 2
MSNHDETTLELTPNEQIAQRREKLSKLRKQGNPFPNDFRPNANIADLQATYAEKTHDELETLQKQVTISGRMMTRRVMGKASFATIQNSSGRFQIYFKQEDAPEIYEQFKSWDLGDIIGVEGVLFKTKTNELTIKTKQIRLLVKALRPLPDKFHGLADHEMRYRQRYLDLIVNEATLKTFQIRSRIIAGIRKFLSDRGYIEVETPMMQTIPGGALARPFITHHNALDMDLYLRIAPELYLKRLVVGGIERVFEINRNFRNEGISTRHNPEFTMLEFYQAYADYRDLMDLTEIMFKTLAQEVLGKLQISYQGEAVDFAKPFLRMTLRDSILHFNKEIRPEQIDNIDAARTLAKSLDIAVHDHFGLGKIRYDLFEKIVEKKLKQPTFITAFPTEVSPLARKNDQDPTITDRFELFAGGQEIANGFSELNDAEDQAERFIAQVRDREAGDLEAMRFDEDFITALEYGMPPTAGEGIGIDRLTMLFTDSASIRDVILFPLLRPQK